MKKIATSIVFMSLLTVGLLQMIAGITIVKADVAPVWRCTIEVDADTLIDTVVFGEATNATDGAPEDSYDVAKPPAPPDSTYVRAWFNDSLPAPYNLLFFDFRAYTTPLQDKTWNLRVKYVLDESAPTNITVRWNKNNVTATGYSSILLKSEEGTVLGDMRTTNSYSFSGLSDTLYKFKIVCTTVEGHEPPPGGGGEPTFQTPIAVITASQSIGLVGNPIVFNGSKSSDADGYITDWSWNFGDGITDSGRTTTHAFDQIGSYTIRLTVKDDDQLTNSTVVVVQIITANQPPTRPVIAGPSQGSKNLQYNFTVASTDADNDPLHYTVTWGDSSQSDSQFLDNGTSYVVSHTWSTPGRYIITSTVSDNITLSETASHPIFIDVTFVEDLGFLFDSNNDGTIDSFYDNASQALNPVQRLSNGTYSFKIDANNSWNYLYDPMTASLMRQEQKASAGGIPTVFFIPVIILIVLALVLVFLLVRRKKHSK